MGFNRCLILEDDCIFNDEIADFGSVIKLMPEYWDLLYLGNSNFKATAKIKDIQSLRSSISKEKLSKMKIEDNHKWMSLKNTNIEFYLKRGFSLEESIKLRKNRQRTFSKEICIKKFGKLEGEEVWKKRQQKWLKSLSESDILMNKDSNSSFYFKNKFSNNWILEAINKSFFCNKELLKISLMNSNDLDTFCEQIYFNKKIFSVNELSTIFNSKLLHDYFDSNKKELKETLLKKYGTLPTKFGNIRYFNGHICRSNGEFYIANKLYENNISYTYEKKYPNSTLISDFYIEKYEIYVEYLGFLKNDFMNTYNQEICTEYKNRVDSKIKFCKENNIKFIFESDFKLIINKILNYEPDTNN